MFLSFSFLFKKTPPKKIDGNGRIPLLMISAKRSHVKRK